MEFIYQQIKHFPYFGIKAPVTQVHTALMPPPAPPARKPSVQGIIHQATRTPSMQDFIHQVYNTCLPPQKYTIWI